jgi:hypothetical protein
LGAFTQWLQVAQLVAAQSAQLLPDPATARLEPPLPLLMAENKEMARDVSRLPQPAHGAGASALLMGRSF